MRGDALEGSHGGQNGPRHQEDANMFDIIKAQICTDSLLVGLDIDERAGISGVTRRGLLREACRGSCGTLARFGCL